jgi:hypothetical protein
LFWAGGALTTTQEDQFKAAWDTYLSALASSPTYTQLGTIYTASTWANLTGFTTNGATASIVSNKIQLTGGDGSFTKSLDFNRYTCLENWKYTIQVKCDTKSSGVGGFGVGLRSVSSHDKYDAAIWFSSSSTVSTGVGFVYSGAQGVYTQRAATSALSFSAGDVIEMIAERDGDTFYITTRNVTTASASLTATYQYSSTSPILPNTSTFSIFTLGGTETIQSLTLESDEQKYAPFLALGDSKTEYYYASQYNLRWAAVLGDYIGVGVVLAGSSDRTAEYLLRTQEVIDLAPRVVIIGGASNDPRFSVSSSTTNTNYDALTSTLTGAGLRVVHSTGFYESGGLDQTPLQNHINSTFSPLDIVDTLPVVITLNADLVHPATAGHATIATTFINSNKISY